MPLENIRTCIGNATTTTSTKQIETRQATFIPNEPFPLASALESLVSPSRSKEQYFTRAIYYQSITF